MLSDNPSLTMSGRSIRPNIGKTVLVDFGVYRGFDGGVVVRTSRVAATIKFRRMGIVAVPFHVCRSLPA